MIREAVTRVEATIEVVVTDEEIEEAEGDTLQAVQNLIGHTGAVVVSVDG